MSFVLHACLLAPVVDLGPPIADPPPAQSLDSAASDPVDPEQRADELMSESWNVTDAVAAVKKIDEAYEIYLNVNSEMAKDVRIYLANTLQLAFVESRDSQYLERAYELLVEARDDAADEDSRRKIEAELSKVSRELDEIEAAEAERQALEDELEAARLEQRAVAEEGAEPARATPDAGRPKRMLPRWAEILGVTAGAGLIIGGTLMATFSGLCTDTLADPTKEPEDLMRPLGPEDKPCDSVFPRSNLALGASLAGLGGALLLSSSVMLGVDEHRVGAAKGKRAMLYYTIRF